MDVIIVGAGIGGLALANGLLADGHRVRVFEAAPAPRRGGAAVTIFSNGFAALAGLDVPVTGLGGRIEYMDFDLHTGRRFSRLDLTGLERSTGYGVATVPREQLVDALAAELPAGTISGTRGIVAVDVDGQQPCVTDSTGEQHRGDALVGADGQRSVIRSAVLDPAAASATGWTTWQGLDHALPDVVNGTTGLCVVGPAGLCGIMPAGGGLVQWWFDVPDAIDDHPLDALRARFGRYAAPVPQLLDEVAGAEVGRYPHVVHAVPDRWGRGAATLLGDAAHAFPPSQAQGANQALDDAWALRQALRGREPIADRLRAYERRRAPRVRRVSRRAASEITNKMPPLPLRLAARVTTPAMAGRAWLSAIRSYSSVLNDDRRDRRT